MLYLILLRLRLQGSWQHLPVIPQLVTVRSDWMRARLDRLCDQTTHGAQQRKTLQDLQRVFRLCWDLFESRR
jgi:hypothetical protein